MRATLAARALLTVEFSCACGGGNTPPQGGDTTAKTVALESGANLMQAKASVEKIAIYLNGFHVSKDDPKKQTEAHHYCNQANEDLAQCVLFDGNTADPRMMGLEYIISEKLSRRDPPRRGRTGIRTTTKCSPASCGCPACRTRSKRKRGKTRSIATARPGTPG
jgi:hypothetical protein